jgi:hypothetical protein
MTRSRRLWVFVLVVPAGAALFGCERPDWKLSDTARVVGSGGTATAGSAGIAGNECAIDGTKGATPIFAPQAVLNTSPARRDLFAYVSDSDAAALRSSRTLFPPLAPGTVALTPPVLSRLQGALASASPAGQSLIGSLQQRFQRALSTWPNPWALRLVDHPGSEHMNPVHIVLRDDAWIGRLSDGALAVMDLKNQVVSLDVAALSPERIAAIYFVVSPKSVTFTNCEDGFRDISLGNEGMVESWSLGTTEILDRLDADVQLLTELFGVVRSCNTVDKPGMTFHSNTVCSVWASFGTVTEYSAYGWALANPVELYKPERQNLLSLVEALKGDRFEPEPFVVEPALPAAGGSGGTAGGAAGASGGGGMSTGGTGGDDPGGAGGELP